MLTSNILLAEKELTIANSLAAFLAQHVRSVKMVHSLPELKWEILRADASALVADLETISLADVAGLRREFHLPIICTHRVPDDELWTAAIEAGAADVCEKANVGSLLRALRNTHAAARFGAA